MRIFFNVQIFEKIIKMPCERYSDEEKSQCVLWKAQGYKCTQMQRMFCIIYNKSPASRSNIVDGTMIIVHMGRPSTDTEIDVRKSVTKSNLKFAKIFTTLRPYLFSKQRFNSTFITQQCEIFLKKSSRCFLANCKIH